MKAIKKVLMVRQVLALVAIVLFASSAMNGQKASVTVSLDEAFFDALLSSIYDNFGPPEFVLAQNTVVDRPFLPIAAAEPRKDSFAFAPTPSCKQTIKILREMGGVRTAVRFREGKIYLPLAFSGMYAPPFVGCVEFAGWAETNIDLVFDQNGQRLIGNVKVLNVNLNGTGGIGSQLIARMLQSSIDKKLNPIEILTLDKLSLGVPLQNAGTLRMRAVGARPVVGNGSVNIHLDYVFSKG